MESEELAECTHEYITTEGSCGYCGLTDLYWNYPKETSAPSKTVARSILTDLTKHNFPEEIKHTANEVYQRIGMMTKRGRERDKMLFFCVYTAYKSKGQCINPKVLAKEMGISNGDVNRALTSFSQIQTGFSLPSVKTSPIDTIPEFCTALNLDNVTEDVIELTKDILQKCPSLHEEFPHKVGAGILRYYIEINGIQIPSEVFRKTVEFSDVTIKDIYERIMRIHNG